MKRMKKKVKELLHLEQRDPPQELSQDPLQPGPPESPPREPSQDPLQPGPSESAPPVPPFPDGVKVLHDCPDATVDICFVHGLTGNRDSTWTADGQSTPWPGTLLPQKLKNARILTYGYDAYVLRRSVASNNRLKDHAKNLLNDLTTDRASCEARSRPLIFVAHSLGGLVCKEAILHSRNHPESHLRDIFDCTKGIIFMGTPHKGSWMADWGRIPARAIGLVKSTNESLLGILETKDQFLESIQGRFLDMSERVETPPQPFATIPFSRDPDFVDRGDILDQLRQRCLEPAGRVALVGLGGIGKSQLAIEFAHRTAEETPNKWIFWIHAGTQARVEEGFQAIANAVKLPGRNQPKADVLQLVYGWLSNERNGQWTIILDSTDDGDVFYATNDGREGKPLASYLPQSRNGSIVVTTRNKGLAYRLTGNHNNIIEIGPLVLADALLLLERKLGPLPDTDTAKALVQALDFVPLAVSQAAAYIRARSPLSSIVLYLAEFHKGERKPDLLALMSFFDPQGIALSLLKPVNTESVQRDSGSESGSSSDEADDGFEDDVAILQDFCLVSTSENASVLEMHGLVQLSMRQWLEADGLQDKFRRQFVKRMAAAFPTGDYSNWATCQQLFAHVEAAIDCRPTEEGIKAGGRRLKS
ncbi:hypothetical protein GGTG_13524 [Gaeumannomyces tritici R3-111a-1]|uniref:NB-ARC domain-containing protein n=1 Tax=Gaeumannomyces tritici (strain R3-111a-1) TaxID=644352 RepID=J3PJ41_GAET3|nr:hypothetical protein GGTG_13524 [Gaeumannomyces tritici R3-111a-1]EJT68935.1 hypothetical protein GGTG_13524 [Gaeumannomyces tritici R3-111a-1]